MVLTTGTRLGSYELLSHIGAGGMGEVYRAKDLRLGRNVALKVLRDEFASEQQRLIRFEQEARSASALSHPNIVTIYNIGTHDGTRYIAMELVEGHTLREILRNGPLSSRRMLPLAVQLADGLARAHAAGIVHRDLKPENLMVTGDGFMKILDFGLAKLAPRSPRLLESATGETAGVLTGSGVILGTVGYMSPEQASGKQISFRSDQFSLGLILYEMLTGKPAFRRETPAQTLAAIIEAEPAPIPDDPAIPSELPGIILRCLEKNPDRRYDSTLDLARTLRSLQDSDLPAHSLPGVSVPGRAITWRTAVGVLGSALALGVAGYLLVPRNESLPSLSNPVQLTSAGGAELYPAWSPDGQTLTYDSFESGNGDIWVTQLGAGQALNRTEDHSGVDGFSSWSPDGTQIAFWSERDGGGYFVMGTLAGPPRKVTAAERVVSTNASPPQWSADGTELACVVYDDAEAAAKIVSLRGGDTRRVALPGRSATKRLDLSWSSDGRHFAYVDAPDVSAQVTRLRVASLTGEAYALSDGRTNERSPKWSRDGRTLYFVSNRGGSMDLWQQRMADDGTPEGTPQPLTTGIGITQAAFSPDGAKLIYSKGRQVGNLWRVPIQDPPATWELARQITFDHALVEMVDVAPDDERLLVSSDRSGNPDLWILPIAGGEMQQWTSDPNPDWAPRWSPDGSEVAFYASRNGNRDILVAPTSGGPARTLAHHEAEDLYPDWSPDAGAIAFYSHRSGNRDIWVVDIADGEARQLTVDPGRDRFPRWSPDGKWVLFSSDRGGVQRLWRVPALGGAVEAVTQGPAGFSVWSPDRDQIFFLGDGERAGNIWGVSLEDAQERPVTDFAGKRGKLAPFALATDGRQLFFTWQEDLGDLWVMDVGTAAPASLAAP